MRCICMNISLIEAVFCFQLNISLNVVGYPIMYGPTTTPPASNVILIRTIYFLETLKPVLHAIHKLIPKLQSSRYFNYQRLLDGYWWWINHILVCPSNQCCQSENQCSFITIRIYYVPEQEIINHYYVQMHCWIFRVNE